MRPSKHWYEYMISQGYCTEETIDWTLQCCDSHPYQQQRTQLYTLPTLDAQGNIAMRRLTPAPKRQPQTKTQTTTQPTTQAPTQAPIQPPPQPPTQAAIAGAGSKYTDSVPAEAQRNEFLRVPLWRTASGRRISSVYKRRQLLLP